MSRQVYSKLISSPRRNPQWLSKLVRWAYRKHWHMQQDLACTKIRFRNVKEAFIAKSLEWLKEHCMTISFCWAAAILLAVEMVALNYAELWLRMK